jgi:hypothetical protein
MKVEGLTAPIKAKVPRLLLQRLKSEAKREGTTTSRLFRWYLSRHLVALEEGFAVTRGDTAALVVKVTPQHLVLFEAKRASLGCSVPELVAGVLIRQFA